jgi:GntR family transcriptional repressor for pyruvate dehydrogenase complex
MKKESFIKTENMQFSTLIKPLSSKRAFEEISDQVKELVFSKKLKPGDRLPTERDLAVHFASGRTAVREALRILEQSGLITVRQGNEGGIFVKNVDPHMASVSLYDTIRRADMKLEDVFLVRLPVEELIIDLAITNAGPNELDLLDRSIEEALGMLREAEREGTVDLTLVSQSNIDFHILLARATKNLLLEILMESVMKFIHLFFGAVQPSSDFFRWHIEQHRVILNAIVEKEGTVAKQVLREHDRAVKEHFSDLLRKA